MNIMLGGTLMTLPESLRGPFEDFSAKVGSVEGPAYEEQFKKMLRKEPTWLSAAIAENCFRETGELTIKMPGMKRPTLVQLQAERSDIRRILCDYSTEGPVTLKLGTVLRPDETKSINGSEYERRILSLRTDFRALGWQHRKWLVEHQDEHPELKALLGIVSYIDFPGIEVLRDDGNRSIPYALSDGERWRGSWCWVGTGFRPSGRVAVSASSNAL